MCKDSIQRSTGRLLEKLDKDAGEEANSFKRRPPHLCISIMAVCPLAGDERMGVCAQGAPPIIAS